LLPLTATVPLSCPLLHPGRKPGPHKGRPREGEWQRSPAGNEFGLKFLLGGEAIFEFAQLHQSFAIDRIADRE
jgi:hypothetical protein